MPVSLQEARPAICADFESAGLSRKIDGRLRQFRAFACCRSWDRPAARDRRTAEDGRVTQAFQPPQVVLVARCSIPEVERASHAGPPAACPSRNCKPPGQSRRRGYLGVKHAESGSWRSRLLPTSYDDSAFWRDALKTARPDDRWPILLRRVVPRVHLLQVISSTRSSPCGVGDEKCQGSIAPRAWVPLRSCWY